MVKSLRFMATLLLLAVFSAVSGQTVVFQETFDDVAGTGGNDGGWSGSAANSSISSFNGWSFTKGFKGDKCVKFGTAKAAGKAVTPEIMLNGNGKLTFRAGAWKGDATTLKLSVTGATLDKAEVTMVNEAFTEYTVNITNATAPIKITFESPKAKTRFFLDDVVVSDASGTPKTATTLTFAHPEDYAFTVADGEQTFTNLATLSPSVEGAVITYSSDNENVAIVDGNTGEVLTAGKVGTAKITATYEGNDSYSGSTASYKIIVTDPNAKGSLNNPYSPAEAVAGINDGTLLNQEYYVKGVISQVKEVSTKYGNATYYISADGKTDGEFMIFRGYDIDGAKFTEETQGKIMQGATVVVYGKLIKYGTTPEMGARNKIISYTAPTAVTATIGATGYATLYYSGCALKVPANVTATTYKLNGDKLAISHTYNEGDVIAKGTAVVIRATTADYEFAIAEEEGLADNENILMGTDNETQLTADAEAYFYQLNVNAESDPASVGFYWGNATGEAFKNAAHKAYLKLPKTVEAKSCFLLSDATGINDIVANETLNEGAPMYNIAGQRVNKGYKGIVIQNGKKYIVK